MRPVNHRDTPMSQPALRITRVNIRGPSTILQATDTGLIIRRQSWQSTADKIDHISGRFAHPTFEASHNEQTARSIPVVALTPQTKAVSITIGGTETSESVGSHGRTPTTRESYVAPVLPLPRVTAPAALIRLTGTDRRVGLPASFHKHLVYPYSYTKPLTSGSESPHASGSSIVTANNGSGSVKIIPGTVIKLRRSNSDYHPSASQFSTSINRSNQNTSYVHVSARAGGEIIVTTSSTNDTTYETPKSLLSVQSFGSCTDLRNRSFSIEFNPRSPIPPEKKIYLAETRSFPKTEDQGYHGATTIISTAVKVEMPNVPPSYDFADSKSSGTHLERLPSDMLTGNNHSAENRDKQSPSHSQRSIFDKEAHSRANKVADRSRYFRVQLPCTRSVARSTDFVVTDSLKLYEEQIFCRIDPAQRPQSWCSDIFPAIDGLTVVGDGSYSSSPTSTVSSNSSSSSDASQYQTPHYNRIKLSQSGHTETHRLPTKLFTAAQNLNTPNDEPKTPTSTPASDKSSPFGFNVYADKRSAALRSASGTRIAGKHYAPVTRYVDSGNFSGSSFDDVPSRDSTQIDSKSNGQSSGLGTFPSGFETVRVVNVTESKSTTEPTNNFHLIHSSSPILNDRNNPRHRLVERVSFTRSPDLSRPTEKCSPVQRPDSHFMFHTPTSTPNSASSSLTSNSFIVPPPEPWCTKDASQSNDQALGLCKVENPLVDAQAQHCHCRLAEAEVVDLDFEETSHSPEYIEASNDRMDFSHTCDNSSSGSLVQNLMYSPDFSSDSDDLASSLTRSGTYSFSTLDSEYLSWMRLNVKDVTNSVEAGEHPEPLTPAILDSTPRSEVHYWVDMFNLNPAGLRLNFMDDSCLLAGTLRIHINLIKPVKMSLRQSMDMATADQRVSPGNGDSSAANPSDCPAPARMVSFFLPRGTSKVVYITSSTTSVNAVQSLLDRFHIQESSRKFALYEHTLESNTIISRRLSPSDCPLLVLLNWARSAPNLEQFCRLVQQKRIVLQENDTCDINWKDFTAAELANFLRILDKEENEYRNAILSQYGQIKELIVRRMHELESTQLGDNADHHVAFRSATFASSETLEATRIKGRVKSPVASV